MIDDESLNRRCEHIYFELFLLSRVRVKLIMTMDIRINDVREFSWSCATCPRVDCTNAIYLLFIIRYDTNYLCLLLRAFAAP